MRWNHKRSVFKNHTNCLPLGPGVRSRQKLVRRLRNPPLKFNEQLLHVLNRLPHWCLIAQSSLGEQFLRFWKNDLSWFNRIFSFLTGESLVFLRYSYQGVLKLICVQILLSLIAWILVSIALKKWCFFN